MSTETLKIETLSIRVYESISVSEAVIVGIIFERLTTWKVRPVGTDTLVSIAEYRKLLGDTTSTDKRIAERLRYLESFCINIIRPELQKIYEKHKENIVY